MDFKVGDRVWIGHKIKRVVEEGTVTAVSKTFRTADVRVTLYDEDLREEYEATRCVPWEWLYATENEANDNKAYHYYVNVYETNRAYGGPEEGGWYYNCGHPIGPHPDLAPTYGPFPSRVEANEKLKEIKARVDKANKDEKRRDPNSVLCEGYYACFVEDGLPEAYPKETPRYS